MGLLDADQNLCYHGIKVLHLSFAFIDEHLYWIDHYVLTSGRNSPRMMKSELGRYSGALPLGDYSAPSNPSPRCECTIHDHLSGGRISSYTC